MTAVTQGNRVNAINDGPSDACHALVHEAVHVVDVVGNQLLDAFDAGRRSVLWMGDGDVAPFWKILTPLTLSLVRVRAGLSAYQTDVRQGAERAEPSTQLPTL